MKRLGLKRPTFCALKMRQILSDEWPRLQRGVLVDLHSRRFTSGYLLSRRFAAKLSRRFAATNRTLPGEFNLRHARTRARISTVDIHMKANPALARTSAISGAIAWAFLVFLRTSDSIETDLINKILLLGILVIVPLGLWLVATPDRNGRHSRAYRLAVLMQPAGAMAAVVSFFLEPGPGAALLASGWFVVTTLIAWFGLWRFLPRGFVHAEEVSIDAGLVYLPIGGVWLIMSRLGIQPLGFGDTIVLLTAVHFHFAGFAAPLLAGMAGRAVEPGRRGHKVIRVAVVCIILGTPLVAAGITVSPRLALIGAVIISSGLLLLAIAVVGWVLPALGSLRAKTLLVLSSLCSSTAMLLASVYAYSIVTRKLIVDIPQMAMTHGVANSFGFALCGLIAWSLVKPPSRAALAGMPFSKLSAGWFAGANYFERVGAVSRSKPPALGLVDNFSSYARADFDPATIPETVRSFYEETFRYRLIVRPYWRPGFRLGGRISQWLGAKFGQMRLPVTAESSADRIESKLLPLDDSMDGREGVRGWVRTYEGTDRAMYVAAYAAHSMSGNTYMNIAFPLLGGNLTSILQISPVSELPGAIALSTLPNARPGGDQGVYFANRLTPVRLPINEVITVWAADNEADLASEPMRPTARARHEMWLGGIKFLQLEYDIFRLEPL